MIEIIVNGERLDVHQKDITFHSSNMLFSGSIIDDYSIDFDIPRTTRNERILNPVGALYRGQILGDGVACQLVTNGRTFNSILQVVSIEQSVISIALFAQGLPTELGNKKLNEVIKDDETTIWEMPKAVESVTRPPLQPTPTIDCGEFPFDMANGIYTALLPSYYLPSIRVNKVMTMLTQATGIQFPTIDVNYYLTATNRKYCREYPYQYIYINGYTETSVTDGGSAFCQSEVHITNEEEQNKGASASLIMLHDCRISVTMEVFANLVISPQLPNAKARIYIVDALGHEREVDALISQTNNGYQRRKTRIFEIRKGEVLRLENVANEGAVKMKGVSAFFMKYEEITDTDTNDIYNNEVMPVNLGSTPTTISQFQKHYFNHIGTISNLGEITIKDFLTAICWQIGKKLQFNDNTISFVDVEPIKPIDARIISISPTSDALGQNTTLEDAEGNVVVSVKYQNGFLTDKKALYKSAFYYPKLSAGKPYIRIPIYTADEGEYFKLSKIKGVPLAYAHEVNGTWYLGEPSPMPESTKTIQQLKKVLEIDARTFDDITNLRYITIDGLQFAIIDSDRDVVSGETSFRALQVTNPLPIIQAKGYLLFDNRDKVQFDNKDNIII